MRAMADEKPEVEVLHPRQPKSFLAYLAEQGNGELVAELSKHTADLIEDMREHYDRFRGKTEGEITVKLKFSIGGKTPTGGYQIDGEYTVKRPKAPGTRTLMWLDQGNLATANPRQIVMPLGGQPPRGVA